MALGTPKNLRMNTRRGWPQQAMLGHRMTMVHAPSDSRSSWPSVRLTRQQGAQPIPAM